MKTISRREFNKKMSAGILGAMAVGSGIMPAKNYAEEKKSGKRPNFVFVCSDQHSAKYTGFAGHNFVQTPNMDRIAKRGVVFSSAYCGSPLCAPGRASMMTGMYPSDSNSFCNSTVMDNSYPSWGKRLRDSGYYCWAVGKQDLNPNIDLGFVEEDVEHGHATKPDITSLFRSPVGYRINEREGIDGSGRTTLHKDNIETAKAIQFLRNETKKMEKPWAVFVGLLEPHPAWTGLNKYFDYYLQKVEPYDVSIKELENLPLPYQIMRNFKRVSTPIPAEKIKRAMAAYFSMVSELDEYVGQIYKCLEETDQLDNTYFIYTSDHGESLGDHGMWLKNNLYECDLKIPLVISNPSLPTHKTVDTPVAHVDLVATLIELAGIKAPSELRGKSLIPLIEGKLDKDRFVYSESHSEGNPTGSFMIRKGDWKLIHFSYYSDYLFNLREDPGEKINRINDPGVKEIASELRAILKAQVDPEDVTARAFNLQGKMLENFRDKMNEDELFNLFKSRMGDGQARVIAKGLNKKNKK